MSHVLFFVIACSLFPADSSAQKYAPVWDSYLTEIAVYPEGRLGLNVDFRWKKPGGPSYHTEHQAYVLAYLKKDEKKILQLSQDKTLTGKTGANTLLLDLLVDKTLVTILDTKTAERSEVNVQLQDEVERRKADRLQNTFPFGFRFSNQKLFDALSKHSGFDADAVADSAGYTYFDAKFKIIAFVPVNDCKYADKVLPKIKERYDFAHFMDTSTLIQYFRPLPYRFQFKRIPNGEMLIYID